MLTVNDLCYSETAEKLGIENVPNSYAVKQRLKMLCRLLNEAGISKDRILSGYRCPGLNKKVGGAPSSKHMDGCAADIACKDIYDCICTLAFLNAKSYSSGAYLDYFYMSRGHHKIHVDFVFTRFNI
ncbi:MAG: D-Ala-D-Ala carboxypeptidase family metallohydrolase [Bacteroidales bacterium]